MNSYKSKAKVFCIRLNNYIKFEEDFLLEITDEIEQKIKYSNLTKIEKCDNNVYVFFNRSLHVIIIPFRAFSSNEEIDLFVAFVSGIILKNNSQNTVTTV